MPTKLDINNTVLCLYWNYLITYVASGMWTFGPLCVLLNPRINWASYCATFVAFDAYTRCTTLVSERMQFVLCCLFSWLGQTFADSTVQLSLSMVLWSLYLLTGLQLSMLITREYTVPRHWLMVLQCLLAASTFFSLLIRWLHRLIQLFLLNVLEIFVELMLYLSSVIQILVISVIIAVENVQLLMFKLNYPV